MQKTITFILLSAISIVFIFKGELFPKNSEEKPEQVSKRIITNNQLTSEKPLVTINKPTNHQVKEQRKSVHIVQQKPVEQQSLPTEQVNHARKADRILAEKIAKAGGNPDQLFKSREKNEQAL